MFSEQTPLQKLAPIKSWKRRTKERNSQRKSEREKSPQPSSPLSPREPVLAKSDFSMKLLIDTKSSKVHFAEVGKDVVDFLFNLLGRPIGSIVKLLSENRMVGCISNLYQSLHDLDEIYIQPNYKKTDLLDPSAYSTPFTQNTLLLPAPKAPKKYYRCYNSCTYVTENSETPCPSCGVLMNTEILYVDSSTGKVEANTQGVTGGVVKGGVTYAITDDLTVAPMSIISSITLLNKLHVKDKSVLQEKSGELGFDQGLELLKESLQSKTVLTNVFLQKK